MGRGCTEGWCRCRPTCRCGRWQGPRIGQAICLLNRAKQTPAIAGVCSHTHGSANILVGCVCVTNQTVLQQGFQPCIQTDTFDAATRRRGPHCWGATPKSPVRNSHALLQPFAPLGQPPGLPAHRRSSAGLPHLCLPRCHPGSSAVSASHVLRRRQPATPAGSTPQPCMRSPLRVFRGPRFQSVSRTGCVLHHRLATCAARRHWLRMSYRNATSGVAMTGLSYPGTHLACATWCRTRQVSPCAPAVFPRPHQPTRAGCVQRSLAAHIEDLHLFDQTAGFTQLPALPCPCRPIPEWRIGSKGTLQSPAPVVAWRAPLRAPRFSRASLRLGEPQGLAWQCWGGSPPMRRREDASVGRRPGHDRRASARL